MYLKGWETRRRNAKAKASEEKKSAVETQSMNEAIFGDNAQPMKKYWNSEPRPAEGEVSSGDALLHMALLHRNESLCQYVAEIQTIRRLSIPVHAPIMISRSQAEAIEEFLIEHGFSMFGSTKAA
jgi:hypothetical protein